MTDYETLHKIAKEKMNEKNYKGYHWIQTMQNIDFDKLHKIMKYLKRYRAVRDFCLLYQNGS